MPDRHIFLIGMQGCGKSSLGKRVARETGLSVENASVEFDVETLNLPAVPFGEE